MYPATTPAAVRSTRGRGKVLTVVGESVMYTLLVRRFSYLIKYEARRTRVDWELRGPLAAGWVGTGRASVYQGLAYRSD